MEARVAVLEEIAVSLKQLIEKMDRRMEKIEDRHDADLKWLIGIGIAGIGFLFATMGRGFHWF
jgi:hypothetical protein